MTAVIEQILVLCIFIALGWVFGKKRPAFAQSSSLLSFLLVNLFLPSKVFLSFSHDFTVSYLRDNYVTVAFSLLFLFIFTTLGRLIAPLLTKDPYKRKVFHYTLVIPNFGYMGYVLVESVLGAQGLTNMILFCIPFSLYVYTFGYAMLTGSGNMLKKLKNTSLFGIVLGMICGLLGWQPTGVIKTVLSSSSACVGPVSMLLAGLVLSGFSARELMPERSIWIILALRLIALPALAFALCMGLMQVMELPAAVYPSAVILACLPCGLNTVVFPRLVGEDCRTGAQMALISHVLCCATIPVWMALAL